VYGGTVGMYTYIYKYIYVYIDMKYYKIITFRKSFRCVYVLGYIYMYTYIHSDT
jgi:hypothetical protein